MSTVPHTLEPVHFSPQTIYCGDCLEILSQFPANNVDLIYIDPPFNSNRNYEVFWDDTQEKRAFEDRFGDAMAYIHYMRPRVEQAYRVLKPTGSFFYHCDWHASHYIKLMLDELFGANLFRTEIIWKRTNAKGLAFKSMANNHDTIYYYTKSADYTWNPQYLPLDPDYVTKFYKHVDPETGRRYQLDNLINPNRDRPNLTYEFMGVKRVWRWTKARMERALEDGLVVQAKPGAVPRLKRYLDDSKGKPLDSCWDDIPPISSQSAERLGYPTQKPLALLKRIQSIASNPGDIVLDAFCGCGTALVAAQQLGRRWLGIDISPNACYVMGTRLEKPENNGGCALRQAPPIMGAEEVAASWNAKLGQRFYRSSNLPRSAEQLRLLPPFEFEHWAVLQLGEVLRHKGHSVFAQTNRTKVGDLGLDGKIYLADRASLPRKQGESIFGEKQSYLPVQVKHTQNEKSKIGRPVIDSFAHALERDGRPAGFVIGWEFTKDALGEIERLRKADPQKIVIPVTVRRLIEESFDSELLALMR